MRSSIRTALVVFGLSGGLMMSLACSGANFSMPSAELTSPWDELNLPLKDGTVLYSDSSALSVSYSGNQVKELAPKYAKALKKAGYKETVNLDADDSWVLGGEKDGKKISLSLSHANDMTIMGASAD